MKIQKKKIVDMVVIKTFIEVPYPDLLPLIQNFGKRHKQNFPSDAALF